MLKSRYDDPEYQKQVSLQMLATPTLEIACRAITDQREQIKTLEKSLREANEEIARDASYRQKLRLELEAERDRAEKIVRDLCETFGVHHPDVIHVKYMEVVREMASRYTKEQVDVIVDQSCRVVQSLRDQLLEASAWDVRKFVQNIPEGEGLSHEDGWTIMRTETADAMKKDSMELRELKRQVMNVFTGGKLFPDKKEK